MNINLNFNVYFKIFIYNKNIKGEANYLGEISSPELKAQKSFSDHQLSVISPSVHL